MLDDDNVDHVTSHGVSIADIEAVFMSRPNLDLLDPHRNLSSTS